MVAVAKRLYRRTRWGSPTLPRLHLSERDVEPVNAEDVHRRTYILTILLLGSSALALAAFVDAIINLLLTFPHSHYDSPLICLAVLGALVGLYYLARRGFYQIGAWAFVAVITLAASYALYRWSIDLPTGVLLYALVITMTGILLGTRTAAVVAVGLMVLLGTLGGLQAGGAITTDTSWLHQRVEAGDALTFSVILGIITLVSWLSNREIDRSLQRARRSEQELAEERNSLEVKVVERTRALEQSQRERTLEVQRFAEFGRISAGLLHDLASPLTTASLNLKELEGRRSSPSVQQALQSVHQLERYVGSARRQLQGESALQDFGVIDELEQVLSLLTHHARMVGVSIQLQSKGKPQLFGDPVKFSQLVANLLVNAIEAYADIVKPKRTVIVVRVSLEGGSLKLVVQDFGSGISKAAIPQLFEPFYTTKRGGEGGLGIGLATVKQIAEKDFGGTVDVSCDERKGTCFTVVLHSSPKRNDG